MVQVGDQNWVKEVASEGAEVGSYSGVGEGERD